MVRPALRNWRILKPGRVPGLGNADFGQPQKVADVQQNAPAAPAPDPAPTYHTLEPSP